MKLSYKGDLKGLMEYLQYAGYCEKDAEKKGAKLEKVFQDFSGYTGR